MAATSHDKVEQYETERVKLYKQRRSFAFTAARALQTTYNDSVDANNVLRELNQKCTVKSIAYAKCLENHKVSHSLRSLKLMFLDIEAEISAPVIEDDQDTVLMTLETICYKLMEKTKRKTTSGKKLQRCGKKIHIDKSPLLPSGGNAPPTHAPAPVPLSTDLTLQGMMIRNIEALKYQCSRTLTTEDFMKFIFANRDIDTRFHKYITTIMAQKEDGDKYVALEQEIGQTNTYEQDTTVTKTRRDISITNS